MPRDNIVCQALKSLCTRERLSVRNLFDIGSLFCRSFNVEHVEFVCEFLRSSSRDFSLRHQIRLVGHQDQTREIAVAVRLNVLDPVLNVLKGLSFSDFC